MAGHSRMSPREIAALDQVDAAFHDHAAQFVAKMTAASDQFDALSRALRDLGAEGTQDDGRESDQILDAYDIPQPLRDAWREIKEG